MITSEYLLLQTYYIQFILQPDSEFQGFTRVLVIPRFHSKFGKCFMVQFDSTY